MDSTGYQVIQTLRHHFCISIHHEYKFVKMRTDTNHVFHLMVDLELHGIHGCIIMNTIEELHEDQLGITLTTITWLLTFTGVTALGNDNIGNDMSSNLIQSRIDLCHIMLL